MNVHIQLQKVRVEVQKKCNKKTGANKYFKYFSLDDFLPTANEEFLKVNICPVFNISEDGKVATLTLFGEDGEVVFSTPTARAIIANSSNPIQELGAMNTYLKRYLYLNALELSEGDIVDAQDNTQIDGSKLITPTQKNIILSNGKLIREELTELNVVTKLDIERLSMEEASRLCKLISERKKENE